MNKTLLVACAVAGGLFVALAAPPPAQALPSVNLGIEKKADAVTPVARRGGRAFRGRGFRRGRVAGLRRFRRRRHRRVRRFYYGYGPYVAYGYYGGRCAWLRRGPYAFWWSRYNRCRYYYRSIEER